MRDCLGEVLLGVCVLHTVYQRVESVEPVHGLGGAEA